MKRGGGVQGENDCLVGVCSGKCKQWTRTETDTVLDVKPLLALLRHLLQRQHQLVDILVRDLVVLLRADVGRFGHGGEVFDRFGLGRFRVRAVRLEAFLRAGREVEGSSRCNWVRETGEWWGRGALVGEEAEAKSCGRAEERASGAGEHCERGDQAVRRRDG